MLNLFFLFKTLLFVFQWDDQGPRYNGLLLKLNFSCALEGFAKKAEPCVILKIKGSYDTEARRSGEYIVKTDAFYNTEFVVLGYVHTVSFS